MKFKIEVNERMVEEYFDTIDYIKGCLLKVKPENVEEYQALLGQYENELENIIIERG